MFIKKFFSSLMAGLAISASICYPVTSFAVNLNLSDSPLFLAQSAAPLSMIVMGRNHKLYFEAYNDATDFNGNGELEREELKYNPNLEGGYFGYFENNLCYDYVGAPGNGMGEATGVFESVEYTADRKCPNSRAPWSGDFLNYVTTSRIDALRKVLYGGTRVIDAENRTVVQRAFIPQDAHSWGKEYASLNVDGYLISDYTPLDQPVNGRRHILANMSLSENNANGHIVGLGNTGQPLLRVMQNTPFRVWQWLSIERPVGGTECFDNNNNRTTCVVATAAAGTSAVEVVSSAFIRNATHTTYGIPGNAGHPRNHNDYDAFEQRHATANDREGVSDISEIDGSGNPHGGNNTYLSIFEGQLLIPVDGEYTFYVDGDDAVEFNLFDSNGNDLALVGHYGGHGRCNCLNHNTTVTLTAGTYDFKYRHEEARGGDNYRLRWRFPEDAVPTGNAAIVTNYAVNVEVCDTNVTEDLIAGGHELGSCRQYRQHYKPVGVLQENGETNEQMFGLITGSYENNLQGGVLRKNIGTLTDEINLQTGQFTPLVGVIGTIDRLKIWGFSYETGNGSRYSYLQNAVNGRASSRSCGFTFDREQRNGECNMWGNPIGEMMYEGLRYFAGSAAPTAVFDYVDAGSIDASLGLPKPNWVDPYDVNTGFQYCAKPSQIVISDVNPSYDSDTLPGSFFNAGVAENNANLSSFNFQTIADDIGGTNDGGEGINGTERFIGQSGALFDTAPSGKAVAGLGRVRGLSPEEPTKQGSYSASAVAFFGRTNDLSDNVVEPASLSGDVESSFKQLMETFTVALASPLPELNINVGGNIVTILPFAKTTPDNDAAFVATTGFEPTNQIVDLYIVEQTATRGSFLINFEDVEAGGDHDMDAIVEYNYEVTSNNTLRIDSEAVFAGGGALQHMGFIISGTDNQDGIYLEVRDPSNRNDNSTRYFLDTPENVLPLSLSNNGRGNETLDFDASRTFTVTGASTSTTTLLRDPLWYAAKWGGFDESNSLTPNLRPDELEEWNTDGNEDPDNYFLVTSPLDLQEQLRGAFEPPDNNSSAATVTVSAGSLGSDTLLFQSTFSSANWTGTVAGRPLTANTGELNDAAWTTDERLETQFAATGHVTRTVITYNTTEDKGVPFEWTDPNNANENTLAEDQLNELATDIANGNEAEFVDFIRGDRSNEGSDASDFRERALLLGDIVHSDPLYVPSPRFFLPATWPTIGGTAAPENAGTAQTYSEFRLLFENRDPMVYFGANDGMYHGIRAIGGNTGGEELLAYVPSPVLGNLSALSEQDYMHQYYVDGGSTFFDVFFPDSDDKWHTVAVGSLRGGGQGLFALDITDPDGIDGNYPTFATSNADEIALWEFTDDDDADLGFTFGKPVIIRMANGRWAAVFGNGYNNTNPDTNVSTTGNAVIYVVDIETGNLVKKFDTGFGVAEDPSGFDRPNGISTVSAVDSNADNIVDTLYGGDLLGNVWKLDVSSNNIGQWDFSFTSGGDPEPVYTAEDVNGNLLPITTEIQIGTHPEVRTEGNFLLFFGTGQYIETTDSTTENQLTQTFHGIWDNGSTTIADRNLLQPQTITTEFQRSTGLLVRVSSDHDIDWDNQRGWYMELINQSGAPVANGGERQVSDAQLRNGRIVFTTLIPSADPCQPGGTGWVMELDAANGGSIDNVSPFDITDDGVINSDDLDYNEDGVNDEPIVGIFIATGIPTSPTIIDLPADRDTNTTGGDDGGTDDGGTGDGGTVDGGTDDGGTDDGGTDDGGGDGGEDLAAELKYISVSNGEILRLLESGDLSIIGRQSWREVR